MSKKALTVKYDPVLNEKNYNVFTEEYFSGADVSIHCDGKKLNDVATIEYTVNEQLKPIYGYASHVFDDMAVGNRIIIGSLRVAISNPEGNDYGKKR